MVAAIARDIEIRTVGAALSSRLGGGVSDMTEPRSNGNHDDC
jgi:hypothetical protein